MDTVIAGYQQQIMCQCIFDMS